MIGWVQIPVSAAGRGGALSSVDEITAYYAPAIAIHGDSWIAIRDGWIEKLQKILAARAFFDLDRLA